MAEAPTEPRRVARDEVIARAAEASAGPGTYVDGDAIRARFDGALRIENGTCSVTRAHRSVARRRLRRGEQPDQTTSARMAASGTTGSAHRHGVGKHGRPRAKTKKGRGDQGAWD